MQISELQAALTARAPELGLGTDGIAGRKTMKAVDALLEQVGAIPDAWSDARRLIAAEQAIYAAAGIETGVVDGLVGEQTRHARKVWAARQANGGKPDPRVEAWRDRLAPTLPAAASAKSSPWPRQRDVRAFFGEPGAHQVTLELPFPLRIAWQPDKTVSRFSCHAKVRDALSRIFTATRDHYGYERLKQLRLDMFGGCLNVRRMRGGSAWSMHAWGIAVDIDPDRNQLKFTRAQASLDDPAYAPFWTIVEGEGALSLGRARGYDWMHFQFTRDLS